MKHTLHDRLVTAFSFFAGIGIAAAAFIGYGYIVPVVGAGYSVRLVSIFLVLFGVATGSLCGALFSEYKRNDKILLLSVLLSGLLLMMLPFYAEWLQFFHGKIAERYFVLLYGFAVLFLPVAIISQAIPLTIAGLKGGAVSAYSRKTGIVFSVIMLGVAIGSVIYPVWLIRELGLIWSSISTGFFLALFPGIQIFRQGWRQPGIIGLFITLVLPVLTLKAGKTDESSMFNTHSISEVWEFDNRGIFLNNGWYSELESRHHSNTVLHQIFENCFPQSDVLILGCGELSLLYDCVANRLNTVVLDQSKELLHLFSERFSKNNHIDFKEENPRLFLNQQSNLYDIILIDMLRGDAVPDGIFTAEVFMKIRNAIKPGGIAIIRLPEISQIETLSYGTSALFKTIRSLGLFTELSIRDKNNPSMIFFSGSRDAFDVHLDELNEMRYYPLDSIKVKDIRILTDNRSMLGLYYRKEMDALRLLRSMHSFREPQPFK